MNYKRHKPDKKQDYSNTWDHRIHDQRQEQYYEYDARRPRRYLHSRLDQLWGRADARNHQGN